ncbi:glutamate-rich protein 3-like isoform X2 [Haliotis rubra]|uniref:glutamate-rich protein 3-like isoform X2 n=1 Tax=Haliotis rubra TaxID=36100 RepID=UPI001EE5A96F|nr:glutamate-rich protein 3-like isoform X2 [Haliotis rubra]
MSHVDTSQLSGYNSLSDKHLAGYFANDRMRGHLRKSGLITRRGQIVSETSYRLNIARKEHKKHVKDLLAQAIVHKTLDLERHRQVAIRQKLEEIAKIELVQRVKTQRVRRSDEDILPFLSPRSSRPQSGPSPRPRRHRSAKYRPISAPSNMPDTNSSVYESVDEDGDVIYVDDDGNTIDMSDCEQGVVRSGRSRTPRNREEVDTRHLYSLNPLALRRYANALAKVEQVNTLASPYLIPQIPIPPSSPRTGTARHRSAGNRGRSTSSDKSPKRSPGVDLHRREQPMRHQGDVHSNCVMTMKFHGWALKLARERTDNRQNVTVEQQHCGGNTLTVFKGLIEPGSTFSFTSKRHRGYPFSLTLYVDGRQDARVSTCCEFGHSKKVRLGAKQGHFSFVGIKGMNPCYKCQVQKGLVGGKAPPKKVKMPPSNPGEEVIVVKTTEVPPKETENAKQSDEEETAHDQILIPVEVDGDEAPNNNADAYESDFEDEDDSPSGTSQQPDEVLYHKDWDSQGKQQEAVDEPIAEEQEEEEDKRQIRGLAADFADDEKGDEKNAFVSAEKSANPDAVEDFEDDTLRKVEGYSSEEEDLDGKKDKTIVVEKKLVSQKEDTVKPETVQVKDTAASNRSSPPVTQLKPPGREEDRDGDYSSSESSFSSSSSSSSPSENSTPRDVAERKVVSPTKTLGVVSEADRTPSRIAEATVLSDRSDSYKSSTSSSSASDAESRPTSLPDRPKSPVAETLVQQEEEEERKEEKIKEEKNKLSPSKEEEEPRNEIPAEKSLVSKQTTLPPLMDSARSEPESTATRAGESESVRESSSSSEDSSSYSSSDSESDDLESGPGKDRAPAQKTESKGDSKNVEESVSSSSRSASGSESERSARPITPFPTRKEKVSSKALSDEESDKSSQDKYMGKPAMSPAPVDAAEGPADSTNDMQQNADNAVVSEKRAVLSSAIVAAAAIMAPAVPPDMDSESLMTAAGRSEKKDSPDGDGKKRADSGSSSVDSSSDSSASSSSSSEMESESEGELIVQEETPRGHKDTSPQTGDSREDAASKTVNDVTPAVVSTRSSGGDGAKTEVSDSEEPQQTKLPAPHATPQPEQTTFPSPPRSPSKSHPAGQTEPVPPPVPTVVVIPTTPDIREGQGSGEWQDRAATPVQGPRQTGGLPEQFEYQPKHSAESDDKTGEDGQTRRTSESEAENMHGGNDPDRVADDDAAKWQSVLEFVQAPPQTMHPGSLTPLLEDQNAIDINNINLTKAQVVEIMQTIEIKDNLQAVTISNCSLGVDDMNKLLQSLAKSPSHPRILNLNNNILGPRSVVPLVEILKIKPSIDMLLLQGNPIGNEGLQTLVDGLLDIEFEAQEYKKRESERMGGVPVMSIKGRFCQLQELDLSETSVTDDGMVDVALLLESNLDLHTLSLSSCPDITNPGWSKLATALTKNKNLKTLTIQNNKIGDEGVRILVEGLKNNTSLSTLEVANAGIEEAGGRALIDLLKRNTTVKYLTLRPGNDIPQKTQDEINRYLSLNQTTPSS